MIRHMFPWQHVTYTGPIAFKQVLEHYTIFNLKDYGNVVVSNPMLGIYHINMYQSQAPSVNYSVAQGIPGSHPPKYQLGLSSPTTLSAFWYSEAGSELWWSGECSISWVDSKWLSGVYTIGMTLGYIDEYISICKGFDILIPIYNWLGIWLLDHPFSHGIFENNSELINWGSFGVYICENFLIINRSPLRLKVFPQAWCGLPTPDQTPRDSGLTPSTFGDSPSLISSQLQMSELSQGLKHHGSCCWRSVAAFGARTIWYHIWYWIVISILHVGYHDKTHVSMTTCNIYWAHSL